MFFGFFSPYQLWQAILRQFQLEQENIFFLELIIDRRTIFLSSFYEYASQWQWVKKERKKEYLPINESIRTRTCSVSNSHICRVYFQMKFLFSIPMKSSLKVRWKNKSIEHVKRVLCRRIVNGGGRRCCLL